MKVIGRVLEGYRKARWYVGEGDQRKPHTLPDGSAYPAGTINVVSHKSMVMCPPQDPTTNKAHLMDGRLSNKNILTLTYWSEAEGGVSRLTGVPFLKADTSFEGEGKRMAGWWRGYTRDDQITTGEVEWTRPNYKEKT